MFVVVDVVRKRMIYGRGKRIRVEQLDFQAYGRIKFVLLFLNELPTNVIPVGLAGDGIVGPIEKPSLNFPCTRFKGSRFFNLIFIFITVRMQLIPLRIRQN